MTSKKLAGRRTKASRLRPGDGVDPGDAQAAILGAANVLAGVVGFFENLENGDLVGTAARKALQKGRKRSRALSRVAAEPDE